MGYATRPNTWKRVLVELWRLAEIAKRENTPSAIDATAKLIDALNEYGKQFDLTWLDITRYLPVEARERYPKPAVIPPQVTPYQQGFTAYPSADDSAFERDSIPWMEWWQGWGDAQNEEGRVDEQRVDEQTDNPNG